MIRFYYLATVVFLLLDILVDINVRVAFLDGFPGLRAIYYAVIFTCMALILWKPAWSVVIGAVESLTVLVALILHMGMRTIGGGVMAMESGGGFVTMPEIVNFIIAGAIANYSWQKGLKELHNKTRNS